MAGARSSAASRNRRARAQQPPSSAKRKADSRFLLAAAAALCLITLAAYSNSFATGLALDSRALVTGDPRIRDATADNLGLIFYHTYWWPNGESGLYRPLTTLSYLFNYTVLGNGEHPAGYHRINFFLHLSNVLLLFALMRRLLAGRERALSLAFFTALLWAVHPVLIESVTNIAGRADLLAGLAVLSGFWMYLRAADSAGWHRRLWFTGLAFAAAIGAYSKESAVILPGVIILYELIRAKRRWRVMLIGCAVLLVPIGLILWQRESVLASSPPAEFLFVDNPIAGAGFWIGRLTAVKVLARYLLIAFWPVRLSADYSYSQISLFRGSAAEWVALAAVIAATAVALVVLKRNRLAFFFVMFAFLNLLPASNLLFPIGTIMAERLLYLPLAGLIAAVVIAIDIRSLAAVIAVAAVAGSLAVRTWLRNPDWTNDESMAIASVRTSPHSFKAHRLLASTLFATDIDRALAEADKSVAIVSSLPDYLSLPSPWNLDAACHLAKGEKLSGSLAAGEKISSDAALREFETAAKIAHRSIEIDATARAFYARRHWIETPVPPTAAEGYRLLSSAELRLGKTSEALEAALEAETMNPANADIYVEIADSYLALGRAEDAAITLEQGSFATGDQNLRTELLKVYQGGVDKKGCAVIPGPGGPVINPSCEIVLRDLCEAATRARREDFRNQLGCPKR